MTAPLIPTREVPALLAGLTTHPRPFTLPRRGEKGCYKEGWQNGWPLDAARRHLQQGGNLGLLLGASGLYALDFDLVSFPEFLESYPGLASCYHVTHPSRPERGKLLFHCPTTLYGTSCKSKALQLLGLSKTTERATQAIVAGIHPDGRDAYEVRGSRLPTLTPDQVEAIWHVLTGETLARLTPPTPKTPRPPDRPGDDFVERVKAAWPTLAVFERFGKADKPKRDRDGEIRLQDNGGLLVHPDGRWFCFSEQVGGDCLDAWGWCTHGQAWDRTDKAMFREVLHEMAEAAGIARPYAVVDPELERTLDHLDSQEFIGRSRLTDAAVFRALGTIARRTGWVEVGASVYELAELAGVSHTTAGTALQRLTDAGRIALAYEAHGVQPAVWRLLIPEQPCHKPTPDGDTETPEGACQSFSWSPECQADSGMPDTLWQGYSGICRVWDGDDVFAYGGRVRPDLLERGDLLDVLGKPALSVIAALCGHPGGLSLSELAELAHVCTATASHKARLLQNLGLVWRERVGRTTICTLMANWREVLEGLRGRMTTFGKGLKRRMGHARARVGMYTRLARFQSAVRDHLRDLAERERRRLGALEADYQAQRPALGYWHDLSRQKRHETLQSTRPLTYLELIERDAMATVPGRAEVPLVAKVPTRPLPAGYEWVNVGAGAPIPF